MNSPSRKQPLIALDADGVLVDYHEGYARAWALAFGSRPAVKDHFAYHPRDYWDVPVLDRAGQLHLATHGFTKDIWASMPAMPGAVAACDALADAGFLLASVTALPPSMGAARQANFKALGLPINTVYAVGHSLARNPKRSKLQELAPVAMVDDLLPYLQDLPPGVWRALVVGRPHLSPNANPELQAPDSRHESLAEFARWALSAEGRSKL